MSSIFGHRHHTLFSLFPQCRRRSYSSGRQLLEILKERGLVQDVTRPQDLQQALQQQQGVYLGFDPTARSLHAGHLLPLICLLHFQLAGHRTFPLIGGATGLVGDPSGRVLERPLQEQLRIQDNVDHLEQNIQSFFESAQKYARKREPSTETDLKAPNVLNNLEWHAKISFLDFLRTTGRHARVSTMLARESVQTRLASSTGLSFAEFTYQLLQAQDFAQLFSSLDTQCSIQIGGADQWGNILAGLDLIGRLHGVAESEQGVEDAAPMTDNAGSRAFGVLTPLLTTSSGEKFGKTAGNAIWLDSSLTSVFDFYQFFMKTTDADVGRYLSMFTLLSSETIKNTMKAHYFEPHKREAQQLLASEVTELVHGELSVARAQTVTKVLFGTQYGDLKARDVAFALSGDPRLRYVDEEQMFGATATVAKLVKDFGLVKSNSVAKNLIAASGLTLNGLRVSTAGMTISRADLVDGRLAIFRAGKDKHLVLCLRDGDYEGNS